MSRAELREEEECRRQESTDEFERLIDMRS